MVFCVSNKSCFKTMFCVVFVAMLLYLHVFRFPSDYEIESSIVEAVNNNKKIDFGVYGNVDVVCFLQSYATPKKLNDYITKDSLNYLDFRINSITGIGDNVWWILLLDNKNIVNLFRMSGKIRPNIKGVQCFNSDDIFFYKTNQDGNVLDFDIVQTRREK